LVSPVGAVGAPCLRVCPAGAFGASVGAAEGLRGTRPLSARPVQVSPQTRWERRGAAELLFEEAAARGRGPRAVLGALAEVVARGSSCGQVGSATGDERRCRRASGVDLPDESRPAHLVRRSRRRRRSLVRDATWSARRTAGGDREDVGRAGRACSRRQRPRSRVSRRDRVSGRKSGAIEVAPEMGKAGPQAIPRTQAGRPAASFEGRRWAKTQDVGTPGGFGSAFLDPGASGFVQLGLCGERPLLYVRPGRFLGVWGAAAAECAGAAAPEAPRRANRRHGSDSTMRRAGASGEDLRSSWLRRPWRACGRRRRRPSEGMWTPPYEGRPCGGSGRRRPWRACGRRRRRPSKGMWTPPYGGHPTEGQG